MPAGASRRSSREVGRRRVTTTATADAGEQRRRGSGLRAPVRVQRADDVVADSEHHRRPEGESQASRPQVVGPVALGREHDPAADDRNAAEDQQHPHGLAEEDEGDRDGEERRDAGGHRGPRRAGLADGEREEQLRDAGCEQAREPEPPRAGVVVAHERGRERKAERRQQRRERRAHCIAAVAQAGPDRDRHRTEGRRRTRSERRTVTPDPVRRLRATGAPRPHGRAAPARSLPRARPARSRP